MRRREPWRAAINGFIPSITGLELDALIGEGPPRTDYGVAGNASASVVLSSVSVSPLSTVTTSGPITLDAHKLVTGTKGRKNFNHGMKFNGEKSEVGQRSGLSGSTNVGQTLAGE